MEGGQNYFVTISFEKDSDSDSVKRRKNMKKSISLLGRMFLLTVFVLAAGSIFVLKTEAKDVVLQRGEEVFYDGHSTFYYYIDGAYGYCMEPSKNSPHDGNYAAELLNEESLLSKALYYVYGGPGYETHLKPDLPSEWQETSRAYCLSHCVLSYIYNGGNKEAFLGLNEPMQVLVLNCIEKIQGFPDIPKPDLDFSKRDVTAYFSLDEKCQRTEEIVCIGDKNNSVELNLPKGVSLFNVTKGTKSQGKVSVSGEDRFYLLSDVKDYNGEKWSSGEVYGKNRQKWRCLVVSTGGEGQHLGTGQFVSADNMPVSLSVTWLPKPKLEVEKHADKTDKKFEVGDLITYSIDVTQQIEHAVAQNVVITDTILTEGVKLQKNSIVLLDQNHSIVSDAVISVKGNSYTIQTGEFLQSIQTGEKYTVEYQVMINDQKLIGQEIENEVIVRADNCEEERDDEKVIVEEPEEPEPKEAEKPEPEEPEPEKPQPEEPEPEAPSQNVKSAPVKTGDEQNLIVLILLLILSCTVIFVCGKIAHKTK